MSRPTRSAALVAACRRDAFSRRHACQGPEKYVERPAFELEHRGSRPPRGTSGRGRRARSPASSDCSSRSSHSRLSTSRWFVGSSSSSRSGSPPSARASDARVSSPPENVSSWRSRSLVREAEPAHDGGCALAPVVAAGVLEPRLRLAVAANRRLVVVARGHRLLEPPQLLLERDQVAGAREHVVAQRQTPLAAAVAGRAVRRACPSGSQLAARAGSSRPTSARSSVVLPAPLRPASATRSRRSTLNETPSKSGSPENSLRRLDAIKTATAVRVRLVTRVLALDVGTSSVRAHRFEDAAEERDASARRDYAGESIRTPFSSHVRT